MTPPSARKRKSPLATTNGTSSKPYTAANHDSAPPAGQAGAARFDLAAVRVSVFAKATATAPRAEKFITDILTEIADGSHHAAVSAVRAAFAKGGKDAAKPLKKKLLCFTVAGTFTRRANEALATRSGFIIADLDDMPADRLAVVRALVEADPHTVAAFTSPTGTGLKIIYRIGARRTHSEGFADARANVIELTGEEIDQSGKDISRLCFVSDDPALYLNPHAVPLPPAPDEPDTADPCEVDDGKKPDAETVAELLACIPPRRPYWEWLRIASAVWDALGEVAGTAAVAAWSPEEKPGEYAEKCRHRLTRVKAGTLFYLAAKHDPARAATLRTKSTESHRLFFDGSAYWRWEDGGFFGRVTREDVKLHYNMAGLSKTGNPSPCDAALHNLQRRNRVDYAGPLCGRPAGLHLENGLRVLATRGPSWIEGEAGEWPLIDSVLSNLLGRAVSDTHAETQKALLFAWLLLARDALRHPDQHRPAQVLALVGPPDCGKSLLQSAIITPALGGRVADPGLFFIGKTDFNADLWAAEHLALGDKSLDVEGPQRATLRNELKRTVAEPTAPLHPKHRDALTLRPVWRLSLSANDDAESASNLPTLDAGFADKIIYLQCYAPPAPFYDAETQGGREAFAAQLRAELPAFLAAVDSFTIPAELRKARFGVTEWHHPAILDLLGEGDPLRPISDILENWISKWEEGKESAELPTVELFALLDANAIGGLTRPKICSGPKHLGHQLAKLAEKPEWAGRLLHGVRRLGGRAANRPQAVWLIVRGGLI